MIASYAAEVTGAGERFRVAFDNAVIGMALVAPDGRWMQTNAALQRTLGYSEDELACLTFADVTHPDDLPSAQHRIRRRLRGEATDERIEKRYIRSNGEAIWVSVGSTLVRSPDGRPLYSVAQIEDISERVRARGALEEAEERFRRAFDDAPIGMALVSPDGRFVRANRTMCELTGYEEHELLARTFADITHPDDLRADLEQSKRLLDGEIRSFRMEKRYRRADGTLIWVMLSVSLVRSSEGEPLHFVSQVEDITERRDAERRLRHLADHDPLTGVLNRRRLHQELDRELRLVLRQPLRSAALLVIDIDRFKGINDSYGHLAGDEVLQGVARVLERRVRNTDLVARLGGDEFAVLLPCAETEEDAARVASDIANEIRSSPIQTAQRLVPTTVSIGVVKLRGRHFSNGEQALSAADLAMYTAKRNGRDRIAHVASRL